MTIQVSTPVAETRYLSREVDESGETYVVIKPPDYSADTERSRLLEKHTLIPDGGFFHTRVDVNLNELWALEIWLTYVDSNLTVEFLDTDGKVTKTVSFPQRTELKRSEFMRRLGELPPGIVYDWHLRVVEVVPDWASPFW